MLSLCGQCHYGIQELLPAVGLRQMGMVFLQSLNPGLFKLGTHDQQWN
jgi:hypothetical protein